MKKVRADIQGQRFGRLTALRYDHTNKSQNAVWECLCDCGQKKLVMAVSLKSGNTKSCGCLQREIASQRRKTHGEAHSRLHTVWIGMKQRCTNPNRFCYEHYGGRGISVCEEWLNSFELFCEWAMANGYKPDAMRGECTLDRIDTDGNYCPENCRWVTNAEQQRNKRKRRKPC
jgi:hypothetical protein